MTRNIFTHLLIGAIVVFVLNSCTSTSTQHETKNISAALLQSFSILQGFTTDTATQISVLVPKGKNIRYFVRAESDEGTLELRDIEVQRHQRNYSIWATDKVFISGLEPNRPYTFEVRGELGELLDAREIRAANIYKSSFRFAAASCLDDSYAAVQKKMWPELISKNPDYIFLIGDNVYATKPHSMLGDVSPEKLWDRYVQTRLRLDLFKSPRLYPTLATWDDHDYGKQDGDRDYTYKIESREIFEAFYAQEQDHRILESGPGVAFHFRGFQQNFYFMDDRSFRSPNRKAIEDETHWGPTQERWLLEGLKVSTAPTWIINGDQIYGGYHRFESYEGSHPNSFYNFQNKIAKADTPYMYLSGDRHLIEVMKIINPTLGIGTFEITTSGLHAVLKTDHWVKDPNPRQIEGRLGLYNYVIIESENIDDNLHARLTAYTVQNEILFHRYFQVRKGTGTKRISSK